MCIRDSPPPGQVGGQDGEFGFGRVGLAGAHQRQGEVELQLGLSLIHI
ncbi:hypothetical protein [Dyella sp. ASV21]|nr:hypothetical protein [Dyella sp. ASV21]